MSAKVAHHFNLSFVYAGLAQYLAVAKNLATAKLCSKVLIDAMHRASEVGFLAESEYGIFDIRQRLSHLSEERECIRLFTQCKHTCLLKRWYVEEGEGATEVGFLAEYVRQL
eukprot:scaffold16209_cov97-Skeletonema_dohrnii-CCMP3373.AAC.1